jgi:hypothetical protein
MHIMLKKHHVHKNQKEQFFEGSALFFINAGF